MVQLNCHLILKLVNHVTYFVNMEFIGHNYWQLAFIHVLTTAIHIWTVEVFLTIRKKEYILNCVCVGGACYEFGNPMS